MVFFPSHILYTSLLATENLYTPLLIASTILFLKGFLDKAEEHFLKAVDFQQKGSQSAYAAFTNFFLGETYLGQREYGKSQKHCERAIALWQQCRTNPSYIIMNEIIIVFVKVMNKEKDIKLHEVFKWYEDIKSKWVEGLMSNCIGAILLNSDDQNIFEAENWIIKKPVKKYSVYG